MHHYATQRLTPWQTFTSAIGGGRSLAVPRQTDGVTEEVAPAGTGANQIDNATTGIKLSKNRARSPSARRRSPRRPTIVSGATGSPSMRRTATLGKQVIYSDPRPACPCGSTAGHDGRPLRSPVLRDLGIDGVAAVDFAGSLQSVLYGVTALSSTVPFKKRDGTTTGDGDLRDDGRPAHGEHDQLAESMATRAYFPEATPRRSSARGWTHDSGVKQARRAHPGTSTLVDRHAPDSAGHLVRGVLLRRYVSDPVPRHRGHGHPGNCGAWRITPTTTSGSLRSIPQSGGTATVTATCSAHPGPGPDVALRIGTFWAPPSPRATIAAGQPRGGDRAGARPAPPKPNARTQRADPLGRPPRARICRSTARHRHHLPRLVRFLHDRAVRATGRMPEPSRSRRPRARPRQDPDERGGRLTTRRRSSSSARRPPAALALAGSSRPWSPSCRRSPG
jgi:hypothetical protein